jgi:hypothetical protein
MTAYLLLNHLVNFLAPAAVLALFMVLLTRIFYGSAGQKKFAKTTLRRQFGVAFALNLTLSTAGLLLFGNDAKMLSYFAMALGSAVCQWRLVRA